MKFELGLSNLQDDARTNHPIVRVTATIQEGDTVTPGTMHMEEFALESLGNFLGAVRDDQARGLEADGVFEEVEEKDANELSDELNPETHDVEDGDAVSREDANELNKQDKEAEDEAREAAVEGRDSMGDEPVETADDVTDTSDGAEAVIEDQPKPKRSRSKK